MKEEGDEREYWEGLMEEEEVVVAAAAEDEEID